MSKLPACPQLGPRVDGWLDAVGLLGSLAAPQLLPVFLVLREGAAQDKTPYPPPAPGLPRDGNQRSGALKAQLTPSTA